jgi:hypothetical protein
MLLWFRLATALPFTLQPPLCWLLLLGLVAGGAALSCVPPPSWQVASSLPRLWVVGDPCRPAADPQFFHTLECTLLLHRLVCHPCLQVRLRGVGFGLGESLVRPVSGQQRLRLLA